jgi:hypothetical protein
MKSKEKLAGMLEKIRWENSFRMLNGKIAASELSKEMAKEILKDTELIKMIVDEFVEIDVEEYSKIYEKWGDEEWDLDFVDYLSKEEFKGKVLKIKEVKNAVQNN